VGEISAQAAWELLSADQAAVLVDVRTKVEWKHVGVPDLSAVSKRPLFIEWATEVGLNPDFVTELEQAAPNHGGPMIFICRSGARSAAAATVMAARGYAACYNLAGGFEATADLGPPQGTVGGWKISGLPWEQA
jgi:rhodanese-related sulfurtransferase